MLISTTLYFDYSLISCYIFIVPLNEDNCTNGDIRLVGGQSEFEGQVEICFSGSWGSVCSNGWDQRDAAVACWQLGHTDIG